MGHIHACSRAHTGVSGSADLRMREATFRAGERSFYLTCEGSNIFDCKRGSSLSSEVRPDSADVCKGEPWQRPYLRGRSCVCIMSTQGPRQGGDVAVAVLGFPTAHWPCIPHRTERLNSCSKAALRQVSWTAALQAPAQVTAIASKLGLALAMRCSRSSFVKACALTRLWQNWLHCACRQDPNDPRLVVLSFRWPHRACARRLKFPKMQPLLLQPLG